MDFFGPHTCLWFGEAFEAPTPVQADGWAQIASGDHALLIAPTGSGKTLAAFLWALDRLSRLDDSAEPGVRVVYVSPLKALVYDVERNLRAPLVGLERAAAQLGERIRVPRIAVRTGDTPAKDRQRFNKAPADILVTTPESLYLMLGSQARETLRTVDTIVVDEVHALAPTKRGAHLALSLERLVHGAGRDPQRIGLSATARPLAEVARWLGGDRDVAIVDRSVAPNADLQILVPVADMTKPEESRPAATAAPKRKPSGSVLASGAGADDAPRQHGLWPAIHPRLLELIRAHRSTIVFVNSRGLCERLTQRLNDLDAAEHADRDPDASPLVLAHHGSLSHERRRDIEEALKAGTVRAIVATSSLELGIDMGAVDLVVMVESPGAVSRGLQRIGRAGHAVGEISSGRIFPKHRGDLLECAVVAHRMMRGEIEPLRIPRNPLDVLAQHVVAAASIEPWAVADLEKLARRAAPFRDLPADAYTGVLDMLSGNYPSDDMADLRPRVVWDRERDVIEGRRGTKQLALVNGGTIPDRGLYAVHLGAEGPRVGELDEEMVHETTPGQTFMLGASTWRVEEITRDRVIVKPAPGEPGKLPFWRGEGPGRPIELGRALGAFVRRLDAATDDEAQSWLTGDHHLDELAAQNLVAYVREQREATGTVPSDRAITVERFRDELGDWRFCILSPFGARVHAPWALALQASLGERAGFEVQAMWSDDGIVLTIADGEELPSLDALLLDADEVEERVLEQLGRSALFATQFRENAARALLLPRRRPGARTPLWAQRLRSQRLLAVAQRHPSFPIVMETYRECMQDVFDLPALVEVLRAIERREVRVEEVETSGPSPFARSLVFEYVASYLYEGDSPLAERKAQALALDRRLLRELLGQEELRELLDAGVMAELEAELQHLTEDRRARHADALHDLLRRVGDLREDEVRARCDEDPTRWLDALERARRVVRVRIAGEPRIIAVEDVATYRDAFGIAPPAGVPGVFLEPRDAPLERLISRYARTHTPFEAGAPAARFGLSSGQVEAALRALEARGRLVHGEMRPLGTSLEWCDPDVLRRIKRLTLARLRNEVAPVDRAVLGRFLPAWHGIGEAAIGRGRLEEAIVQLEGLPLSYGELERSILPARVRGFAPRMLDELGAMGFLVWVGHGALGHDDGRIALYRRDRVARLLEPPAFPAELDDRHRAILGHLESRGASFFTELERACTGATPAQALDALWDLVWAGLVTNDTFQALRSLRMRRKKTVRRRPGKNGDHSGVSGGRWSLVSHLLAGAPEPTERMHARAVMLLDRHGIVSREAAALEAMPGGFGATYRVLRAMEEAGRVRRGYFVEGLGGAQFAYPGAVDRMRALRADPDAPEVVVLSAVDPASPYGWLVPWPDTTSTGQGPRRAAGASVVLVDGVPVVYLDRGGKRMRTFRDTTDRERILVAARALERIARSSRKKVLRIEQIDGNPARGSPLEPLLREADFGADHRGLVLESR